MSSFIKQKKENLSESQISEKQSLKKQIQENNQENIEKISAEQILFTNLRLMGFEFLYNLGGNSNNSNNNEQKLIKEGCFEKENQTVFFIMINFLFKKISDESDFNQFKIYFPPRNKNDIIELKKICLQQFQILEKKGRIPKNFINGKSILDSYKGEGVVVFLKFFSEFSLRFCIQNEFPQYNQKNLNLQKISQLQYQADHQLNEISEIYNQFSNDKINSCSLEDLNLAIECCETHLIMEQEKTKKRLQKIQQFDLFAKQKAHEFSQEFQEARKESIELKNYYNQSKNEIPRTILSDLRGLDRIPKIDLIRKVKEELSQINQYCQGSKLDQLIVDYNNDQNKENELNSINKEDFVSNSKNEYVHLSKMYNNFNESLTLQDQFIVQSQNQEVMVLDESLNSNIKKQRVKMQEDEMNLQKIKTQFQQLLGEIN